MLPEIPKLLRSAAKTVKPFTAVGLAEFFGLPAMHFHRTSPTAPFQFFQAGLAQPVAYGLRGTLFWPNGGQIVRGCPRTLATSDTISDPFAVESERAFYDALSTGREAAIEIKEPGIGVRVTVHGGALCFATDVSYNGANPLLGTGIENLRALGIDCAGQAKRLIEAHFKGAAQLAKLGYVPVFEMLLPERETLVAVERPDMVLTDVIDPDHCFVERLEKERIAEDYGLNCVRLHGKMTAAASPSEFYSRLRGLEHIAAKDDVAGYVLKVPDHGDQITIKVEPPGVRQAWTAVPPCDMRAAFDAALADFARVVSAATARPQSADDFIKLTFFEEVLLEYLGDRRRSVRWQVQEFIGAGGDGPPQTTTH